MLNAFIVWLMEHWDLIIEIFMWGLTLLLAFVLASKIYKIVKLDYEARDSVGLIFAGLWLAMIIFFGFDHIRVFLQSFL